NASQRALSNMVAGQHVRVRNDGIDRFDRVIGVVFVGGHDVNLEMVRLGMAWHYRQFARDQTPAERSAYAAAEQEARAARRGLWADPNPVPPWDFRREPR
ncbi:thermonuclease family protein, partial [Arthrospira platensis SPKY1]|nr:thermonuclease family protein [Arthrospira platensis SPKY1]